MLELQKQYDLFRSAYENRSSDEIYAPRVKPNDATVEILLGEAWYALESL